MLFSLMTLALGTVWASVAAANVASVKLEVEDDLHTQEVETSFDFGGKKQTVYVGGFDVEFLDYDKAIELATTTLRHYGTTLVDGAQSALAGKPLDIKAIPTSEWFDSMMGDLRNRYSSLFR